MKNVILILVLAAIGAGAALVYLRINRQPTTAPSDSTDTGHEALHKAAETGSAQLCARHNVPDSVCPFCHPEYIEKFGFCGGHDVPEALCTRCSPVLIAAFKVENDWCAEHNLPESQCKICKGEAAAPADSNKAEEPDHG